MATFLYFLPGPPRRATKEDVKRVGIEHAFDSMRYTPSEVLGNGPDGGQGCIIAASGVDAGQLGYYPKRQTWRIAPGGKYWIGLTNDSLPTPTDLQREATISGHWQLLPDGNKWLCPVARLAGGNINLPQAIDIDAEGNWIRGEVVQKHAELWRVAQMFWDDILAEIEAAKAESDEKEITINFDFAGQSSATVKALATNYRIGAIEAVMLGLFTDESCRDILWALVDGPTINTFTQKKSDETADS